MKGSPTVHLVYTTYCYDNAQVSGGIVDIVLLLFVFHFIIICSDSTNTSTSNKQFSTL